jgi:hypothetical protein
LFPIAGILICLLEIGYPFLIWNNKTRKIWLIGICVMHVGIGLTMGMYLFAFIMIVLNVAAFGPGLIRTEPQMYQPGTVGRDLWTSGKRVFIWVRVASARKPFALDHRDHRC